MAYIRLVYVKMNYMKKRKRRIKPLRLLLVLMIPILLIGIVLGLFYYISHYILDKEIIFIDECIYDKERYIEFSIDLNSEYYLLSRDNGSDNYIVYASGEREKIYPASLTKLMTMYVVLNHSDNLNEMLEVNYKDLAGLIEANASVLGLNVGDTISIKNALYGLILPSGADCANLLKRYIESQGYDFVVLMNNYARELGMDDTHFSNTTGLYDADNYTTLYDLNLLGHALMDNRDARDILETFYYEDDGYTFISTARRYQKKFDLEYVKVIGGKTGYTLESKLNYFAIIEENSGRKSLLWLAKADEKGQDLKNAHFEDTLDVLETYFKED